MSSAADIERASTASTPILAVKFERHPPPEIQGSVGPLPALGAAAALESADAFPDTLARLLVGLADDTNRRDPPLILQQLDETNHVQALEGLRPQPDSPLHPGCGGHAPAHRTTAMAAGPEDLH